MTELELLESKIISVEELQSWLGLWRFKNKRIVFTNGCFDVIHRGHIEYLSKAADLGDVLILGLNSDQSVSQLKGEGRPILDQETRSKILASIKFVDRVVIFDEETPINLISKVIPDVLVKGADYSQREIVGADIVRNNGGEIVTIELVEGQSSSNIIQKILSLRQ